MWECAEALRVILVEQERDTELWTLVDSDQTRLGQARPEGTHGSGMISQSSKFKMAKTFSS